MSTEVLENFLASDQNLQVSEVFSPAKSHKSKKKLKNLAFRDKQKYQKHGSRKKQRKQSTKNEYCTKPYPYDRKNMRSCEGKQQNFGENSETRTDSCSEVMMEDKKLKRQKHVHEKYYSEANMRLCNDLVFEEPTKIHKKFEFREATMKSCQEKHLLKKKKKQKRFRRECSEIDLDLCNSSVFSRKQKKLNCEADKGSCNVSKKHERTCDESTESCAKFYGETVHEKKRKSLKYKKSETDFEPVIRKINCKEKRKRETIHLPQANVLMSDTEQIDTHNGYFRIDCSDIFGGNESRMHREKEKLYSSDCGEAAKWNQNMIISTSNCQHSNVHPPKDSKLKGYNTIEKRNGNLLGKDNHSDSTLNDSSASEFELGLCNDEHTLSKNSVRESFGFEGTAAKEKHHHARNHVSEINETIHNVCQKKIIQRKKQKKTMNIEQTGDDSNTLMGEKSGRLVTLSELFSSQSNRLVSVEQSPIRKSYRVKKRICKQTACIQNSSKHDHEMKICKMEFSGCVRNKKVKISSEVSGEKSKLMADSAEHENEDHEISCHEEKEEWDESLGILTLHSEKIKPAYDYSQIYDTVEDPVDFDIPLLHARESVDNLTVEDLHEFLSKGVDIKRGRYTKQEESILLQNWSNFSKKYNILNPYMLLGVNVRSRLKLVIDFNKAKHFYARLGKGLDNRTLKSIYAKAKVLLNPGKSGKLSAVELAKLKQLYNEYGGDWVKISQLMNRPPTHCAISYRNHKKDHNTGIWSKEEDKRLRKGVRMFVKSKNWLDSLELCRNIPWEKVSEVVGTRTAVQCYEHWFLSKRIHSKKRVFVKWNDMYAACLICLLYHNKVSDEALIDWRSLFLPFQDCLPSFKSLAKKWCWLRRTLVENYKSMSHGEVLSYLYDQYLPRLLSTLNLSLRDIMRKLNL